MRLAAAALVAVALGSAAVSAPNVGRLTEIPLGFGVNRVPNFADGREARIVLGWRDNGNAHGYALYLVLMPTKRGGSDWNVVGFENGQDFSDDLRDEPHTGEDVVRAVRFVRAGSKRVPLVVVASRNWKETFYDRAETMITIYGLRQNAGIFGTTQDYFTVLHRWKTKRRYCNAELALRDELHLPIPAGYSGANKIDGCIK